MDGETFTHGFLIGVKIVVVMVKGGMMVKVVVMVSHQSRFHSNMDFVFENRTINCSLNNCTGCAVMFYSNFH